MMVFSIGEKGLGMFEDESADYGSSFKFSSFSKFE